MKFKCEKESMQLFADKILEMIENVFGDDVKVRNYSGRGMYGKHCVGIEISDFDIIPQLFYELGQDNEFVDYYDSYNLPAMRWDNMGLDYIIYWPSVEGKMEYEEDEAEEELED